MVTVFVSKVRSVDGPFDEVQEVSTEYLLYILRRVTTVSELRRDGREF